MAMSPEDKMARRAEVWAGERMANFINDELMQKHFNDLLHGWQNAWLDCDDPHGREVLWQRTRALRDFLESLQSVINTGQMAAAQLQMDQGESNE